MVEVIEKSSLKKWIQKSQNWGSIQLVEMNPTRIVTLLQK